MLPEGLGGAITGDARKGAAAGESSLCALPFDMA
jgi:hypothetical protein